MYVFGCVVQGVAIIGFGLMGWLAQTFSGAVAGMLAVALIAVFALGRSLCSISFKDVLGKTVDRGRCGAVSGTAGTIAALATLLLALAYSMGWIALTVPVVSAMVMLGGLCWLLAAFAFGSIREQPGATEGGIDGLAAVIAQLGLLRSNAPLCRRRLRCDRAVAWYRGRAGDLHPDGCTGDTRGDRPGRGSGRVSRCTDDDSCLPSMPCRRRTAAIGVGA